MEDNRIPLQVPEGGLVILVVGSGGREHAIVWKLAQSHLVKKIYVAPGNPGMMPDAELVPIAVEDIEGLKGFALEKGCDLTVVGPEVPLSLGITDVFEASGLKVFGPSKAAARIESSKAFAKDFMVRNGIPTAGYEEFDSASAAIEYLSTNDGPIVVKLDGLAAGKGVVVARDSKEAIEAVRELSSGEEKCHIILEEMLVGTEASILCVSDGQNFCTLLPAQDHKRIGDSNTGPNTGGMGAIAPAPAVDISDIGEITEKVFKPAIAGMAREGYPFVGVLFAGLMMTENGVKVLEFNCRMGDPETQAILPLLKSDFAELLWLATNGRLDGHMPEFYDMSSVCLVMSSKGYPGRYDKGIAMELPKLGSFDQSRCVIFHAGTAMKDGKLVTNGGRVLGVTAVGSSMGEARQKAYDIAREVRFEGAYYRSDIGLVK